MKKLLLMAALLLTATLSEAQMLKITPKMEKGLKHVYNQETTTSLPMQGVTKITSTIDISVSEALSDGYVIDYKISNLKSNADASNIAGRLIGMSTEMLADNVIRFKTDREGKVTGIMNFAEVKQKAEGMFDKIIETLFNEVPNIEQMMSKEQLRQQMLSSFTEQELTKSLLINSSVLNLNGKTIMTGSQDEYTTDQGLKMKRMYIVNGQQIIASSTLNMSKDDIKQMIIAQVEKLIPAQAEMVKSNIDMLINSDAMKLDGSEKATYDIANDGWVKSLQTELTSKIMGQTTKVANNITLQ